PLVAEVVGPGEGLVENEMVAALEHHAAHGRGARAGMAPESERLHRGTPTASMYQRAPPATVMSCIVTAPAASPHSWTARWAISAGATKRPRGIARRTSAMNVAASAPLAAAMSARERRAISVSIQPGLMVLQVTLWGAPSSPAERVSETTAALAAQ